MKKTKMSVILKEDNLPMICSGWYKMYESLSRITYLFFSNKLIFFCSFKVPF